MRPEFYDWASARYAAALEFGGEASRVDTGMLCEELGGELRHGGVQEKRRSPTGEHREGYVKSLARSSAAAAWEKGAKPHTK